MTDPAPSKDVFPQAMPASDSPVTQQEIVSAINYHARELARLTAAWPAPEPCALPTDHPGGLYKVEIAECGCTVLNGVAWHHYCRSISDRNSELEAENARLRAAQPPRDGE